MNKYKKISFSGQSLFEVLIAVAVSSLVLAGLVTLSTISVRNSSSSNNRTEAAKYAQEANEWIRHYRDAGWDSFYDNWGLSSDWCINTLLDPSDSWAPPPTSCADTITGTIFQRSMSFSEDGLDAVNVTIKVSWSDSQGNHDVTVENRLTNWRK